MKISQGNIWLWVMILGAVGLAVTSSMRRHGTSPGSVYVEEVSLTSEDGSATAVQVNVVPYAERTKPGAQRSILRTLGVWVAGLGTLALFSFMYGDNPFYKLTEAVYVGVSAGYVMVTGIWTEIVENLLRRLLPDLMRATVLPGIAENAPVEWLYLFPLALSIMMLWRLAPRGGWIARWPLAFFIGATAGMRLLAHIESDFVQQINATMIPLVVFTADGSFDWATSLKNITIVVGVCVTLVYFFFSLEHKGTVGAVARVGIWVLMITFGAGFGSTVMGRIALLAARLEFLFDDWLWLIDPLGRRIDM